MKNLCTVLVSSLLVGLLLGCAQNSEIEATSEAPATSTPRPTETLPPGSTLLSEGKVWDFGDRGLAYVYKGNICFLAHETPSFLGEAASTVDVWEPSPDDQWIAYERLSTAFTDYVFSSELWLNRLGELNRLDGSQPQMLVDTDEFLSRFPDARPNFVRVKWMPDSTQFLFSTVDDSMLPRYFGDLYRYDLSTGEFALLGSLEPDSLIWSWDYAISPDDNWVASYSQDHLSFMRTDGSDLRKNVFQYEWLPVASEYPAIPDFVPIWAEDSSGVTVSVLGWVPEKPKDSSTPGISTWFIPVMGEAERIGEFTNRFTDGVSEGQSSALLSPGGEYVAYAISNASTVVAMARVDGTAQTTLYEADEPNSIVMAWLDVNTLKVRVGVSEAFLAAVNGTITPIDVPTPSKNPEIPCKPPG